MARSSSVDPLLKFRWEVQIEGFEKLGFSSFQTPSLTVSTKEYPEGGAHFFPRQIPDSISYGEVTLERGVTKDASFASWVADLFDFTKKKINPENYRREVIISHTDRTGAVVKRYRLFNAIPVEYKPASDFSADADDGVSIEKLVIKYEGFSVEKPYKESNPLVDTLKKGLKGLGKKFIRGL